MPQPSIELGWNDSAVSSGAARTARTISSFEGKASSSLKNLIGLDIGRIFAGAGIVAAVAGAKHLFDEFDRIGDLAKQLDTTPEALQRIGNMAKLSGTDVETTARAMNKLNRELADGTGVKAFEELGINAREFQALEVDDQMLLLAKSFQEAEKKGGGLSSAYDLMGRSAAELLPLLRSNVTELEKMARVKVVSNEDIENIQNMNDAYDAFISGAKAETGSFFSDFKDGWKKTMAYIKGEGDLLPSEAADSALNKSLSEAGVARGDKGAQRNADRKRRADAEQKRRVGELTRTFLDQKSATEDAELALNGQLETVDKLRRAREAFVALEQKSQGEIDAPATSEARRLQLSTELLKAKEALLNLERQYKGEVQQTEQQEADKLEQQQKVELSQRESLALYKIETAILSEQVAGHDKKAAAMLRNLKIAQEAKRLVDETGISEEEAVKLAKERADLEDKAANRKKGGIHGYKQSQGAARGADPYHGLDDFDRLQQRNPGDGRPLNPAFNDRSYRSAHSYPGLDNFNRLQDRSQSAFDNTGATRRAARADRADSATTPHGARDNGPELIRILGSIDKTLADATRG